MAGAPLLFVCIIGVRYNACQSGFIVFLQVIHKHYAFCIVERHICDVYTNQMKVVRIYLAQRGCNTHQLIDAAAAWFFA